MDPCISYNVRLECSCKVNARGSAVQYTSWISCFNPNWDVILLIFTLNMLFSPYCTKYFIEHLNHPKEQLDWNY